MLFYGPKVTTQMRACLCFETETGESTYEMRLAHAAQDSVIFTDEQMAFHRTGLPQAQQIFMDAGHKETRISEFAGNGNVTAQVFRRLLMGCRVFQFHDTSPESKVRNNGYIEDNRYLRSEGGNLAAYLHALEENQKNYYTRVVRTVQRVFPWFGDFALHPSETNSRNIVLNWHEKGNSQYLFGPHQLSDGALRFMLLCTLLLQPEDKLPDLLLIDEPELGLHPAAINLLGGMLASVSQHCQVLVATQSPLLLDAFEADDVIVANRQEESVASGNIPSSSSEDALRCETTFTRLHEEELQSWLEDYTLGELWQKNAFGGRPVR